MRKIATKSFNFKDDPRFYMQIWLLSLILFAFNLTLIYYMRKKLLNLAARWLWLFYNWWRCRSRRVFGLVQSADWFCAIPSCQNKFQCQNYWFLVELFATCKGDTLIVFKQAAAAIAYKNFFLKRIIKNREWFLWRE